MTEKSTAVRTNENVKKIMEEIQIEILRKTGIKATYGSIFKKALEDYLNNLKK